MDGDSTKLKAFDFLKDAAVQLITLALGTIVFSATFYKDILAGTSKHHLLIECSWGFFGLSILFGVFVIGMLSWQLNYAAEVAKLDIFQSTSRWTALLQLVTFLSAVATFALFVALNMSAAESNPLPKSATLIGPITATGPLTSTGPVTALGSFGAASVTATGPVSATPRITINTSIRPRHKLRRGADPRGR